MARGNFYRMERTLGASEIISLRPDPEMVLYNFLLWIAGFVVLLTFYVLMSK